jgi:hypothetical protein
MPLLSLRTGGRVINYTELGLTLASPLTGLESFPTRQQFSSLDVRHYQATWPFKIRFASLISILALWPCFSSR